MKKRPEWLLEFSSNVYSQGGEDGIIEKILEIIPGNDKWCVEVGAWDGIYLSNTRNLIENSGFAAVLIEGSSTKYEELRRNYSGNDNVTAINTYIGFSDTDNLDSILVTSPIPNDFDLLSVDVDGNDFHIWKATEKYNPKLVVIEFNQTIPTEVSFVQKADNSVSQGASLLALVELGKEKGYELVSVLGCNAFFVRGEYFPLFHIEDNSPTALRTSLDDITYLFSGYDGKIILQGSQILPWHNIKIRQSGMQQLPRVLQKFPCDYSGFERRLFYMYHIAQQLRDSPFAALKKILSRLMFRNNQFKAERPDRDVSK